METLLWDETFTVPIRYVFFQISSVKNFWVAAWVRNKRSYSLDMSVKSEKHIFNTWSCVKSVTPSEKHILNTWSCVKNIYSILEAAWNLLLPQKNIYSIREAVWNLLLSQKNIYSICEAAWNLLLSQKNIYSIREAAWNLLLYQHILRYELAGATLGRTKIASIWFSW